VPAEIDSNVLPEGNPPTSGPNDDDGRQLSEYVAELAREQEALAEQRAELSRRQDDLQQELEEARRRQRDVDTEMELEAESPESPGSSPEEFKVVARAVLYL
jgi:septal ring factor EnvC (AmiA/AmiB activator)